MDNLPKEVANGIVQSLDGVQKAIENALKGAPITMEIGFMVRVKNEPYISKFVGVKDMLGKQEDDIPLCGFCEERPVMDTGEEVPICRQCQDWANQK